MQRTITLLFIASLLILTSVAAQDFNAFGDTTLDLVPCDTQTSTVTIQNTRQEQATYSLSVDGDGSDFITFSMLSFTLEPGQSAIIDTFYNIPCNTRPGIYTIDIFFDDGEFEKILAQEINIAIPDNIGLTVGETSAVITPCDRAVYEIGLTNPLNFTEIYNVQATGHSNVHVSEKTVVLKGGEQKAIVVNVAPDDCTESGTFPLTVTVDTDKSNQQKQFGLELIIKTTDIPILAEGINNIRTDYIDSTADISITNSGDRATTYTLSIDGVPWASINPTSITLNPGETRNIALRLTPTEEIAQGSYPLTFFATVEETGIQYSKDITIKLQPPTMLETNPVGVIAGIVIIIAVLIGLLFLIKYARSPAFKEKLQKRREKLQKKREQRAAKKQQQIEKKQKALEKKQAQREKLEKKLQRKLESNFKKTHYFVARKDVVKGKKESKTLKLLALGLAVIVLILIILAWSLIAPNFTYVLIGLAVLGIIFLAKQAARQKVIHAYWKLVLAKQTVTITAWKKGLSLLSITTKQPLKELRAQIRKVKTHKPTPATYQTFHIKTNNETELTLKTTITVPKRWMTRKNAIPDDVRLARYNNQRWQNIPLKKTGEDKHFVHYTADLSKTGTYSIFARPRKQPEKKNKLAYGLIALAVIIGLAVILSPQPSTSQGIPSQIWEQDTTHQLDLAQYFQDPDGDPLNYTTTPAEHITIDISGNTAYFTPETGWTGEERVQFIANDNKGGQIESNSVVLRVQKRVIPAKLQPTIAIILSFITILLLLWTVRSQQKR